MTAQQLALFDDPAGTKRCDTCHQDLSLMEFEFDDRMPDLRYTICKKCVAVRQANQSLASARERRARMGSPGGPRSAKRLRSVSGHSLEYDHHVSGQSPEWRAVVEAALEAAGYKCELCPCNDRRRLACAHINDYRCPIGQETPDDVAILCDNCHNVWDKRTGTDYARAVLRTGLAEKRASRWAKQYAWDQQQEASRQWGEVMRHKSVLLAVIKEFDPSAFEAIQAEGWDPLLAAQALLDIRGVRR
jgi:hypothetical protein